MNTKNNLRQYLISILTVCSVTAIGFIISDFTDYKIVAFFLLVAVSILAMLFDIFPVLLAALLSALLWDFLFIPPRFTFSVGSTEDKIMLSMYFVIALVNGVLTYKIRQMEKEARKKEAKEKAIQLYNTLFNSLSHELQTPISTIIGAADTLKDSAAKLSEENKNALVNEISIASLRLNQQVDNLLNMSRLESGYLQLKEDWCDINELIYSAVNKLQNKTDKHKINIVIPDNFPLFKLDFGIMEQILYNLLNNAVQYTPDNSTISINVEFTTSITGHFEKDNKVHRDNTSHTLIINVSDNGKGFPENEIEKVFDKFYRLQNTHPGGTGLGLSIVKGFVVAHRGKITLKNLPTGGAEFRIEIPAKASNLKDIKHE
ncbi:MAG TPA: ATP-binding protein [Bacteroidia bacterium]|jgi:two-component system sensor histidine kinase KdpD|nr:ATP-binding protein [Bacteroidia bacterium]